MNPIIALRRCGGAARRVTLLRAGVSRGAILRAVERGHIVRHPGCYALPRTPDAVLWAVRTSGVATCLSALRIAGVALRDDPVPHVWVPEHRGGRADAAVVWHRTSAYARSEVGSMEASLDLAGLCVTPLDQLIAIDSALNQGLVTRDDVAAFRIGSRERRAWLMSHCDDRAESLLETIARVRLEEAGLTVASQVWFRGIGSVDLLVEGAVVVELDGRAHHSDVAAFRRDRARDRELNALGFQVLRYTYADVIAPEFGVVADVEDVLWRRRGGQFAG